jgi:site-specific recombinase XerD
MSYRKRPASDKGLYPVRNGWEVRWLVRGKLHVKRLRGYSKTDARTFRDDKIADAKAGRTPAIPGKTTFDDLVKMLTADYAAKQNRSTPPLKHLTAAFAGWRADAITTDAVRQFEADRLGAGDARGTVNLQLAMLRRMFRLAVEAGRVATRPVIKTPNPRNVRQGFLEEKELHAVLAKLPAWARAPVEFMGLTGWRSNSEVLPLRWKVNVDKVARVVRLEPGTTKSGEGREFPFGDYPALERLLATQRAVAERADSAFVFPYPGGAAIPYKRLRLAWRAACRAAKCPGKLMHDLRRGMVRRLEHQGVSRSVAMSLTGHKTEAVYRRYAIVDGAAQREGVAKLAAASVKVADR